MREEAIPVFSSGGGRLFCNSYDSGIRTEREGD